VTLTAVRHSIQLVNFGHDPPDGGIVLSNELCVVLELQAPETSIWGESKNFR
jgi:hypothetical protein